MMFGKFIGILIGQLILVWGLSNIKKGGQILVDNEAGKTFFKVNSIYKRVGYAFIVIGIIFPLIIALKRGFETPKDLIGTSALSGFCFLITLLLNLHSKHHFIQLEANQLTIHYVFLPKAIIPLNDIQRVSFIATTYRCKIHTSTSKHKFDAALIGVKQLWEVLESNGIKMPKTPYTN